MKQSLAWMLLALVLACLLGRSRPPAGPLGSYQSWLQKGFHTRSSSYTNAQNGLALWSGPLGLWLSGAEYEFRAEGSLLSQGHVSYTQDGMELDDPERSFHLQLIQHNEPDGSMTLLPR